MAAGLGLNAFVAFTLVGAAGLTWEQAMGVIVIEGLVIAALVLTGFREAVLNAIPMDLKRAIGIGIGLFIAFIGLSNDAPIVIREGRARSSPLDPEYSPRSDASRSSSGSRSPRRWLPGGSRERC